MPDSTTWKKPDRSLIRLYWIQAVSRTSISPSSFYFSGGMVDRYRRLRRLQETMEITNGRYAQGQWA